MDLEIMAKQVEASPNYRVLRRMVPRNQLHDLPATGVKRGVIVDTETTGTDIANDQIIELSIVVFTCDERTGQACRVLETLSELEQSSIPIPPETTKVHGITDDMVRGYR
jgi:DNA polymerase-3 subunit epsilon